ncbi:uncharacterized protein LOC123550507 [Mercenaria mercenaria]|uniref:uncharacterized protein LOC123550507 n=1 Tax=Mercenaria mercenaria TaxID=6596 RepID=UPI00234ED63A|nr:uncharacterized protein LOC123550507 [Mercenaria mercenaria]
MDLRHGILDLLYIFKALMMSGSEEDVIIDSQQDLFVSPEKSAHSKTELSSSVPFSQKSTQPPSPIIISSESESDTEDYPHSPVFKKRRAATGVNRGVYSDETVNQGVNSYSDSDEAVNQGVNSYSDSDEAVDYPNKLVPGFPDWYNIKYSGDRAIYTYELMLEYKRGDLKLIV